MKEYCKIYLYTSGWELEHGYNFYTWGEITSKVRREVKDKNGTYYRNYLKVIPTDKHFEILNPKNIHVRYLEDKTLGIDSLDEYKIYKRKIVKP